MGLHKALQKIKYFIINKREFISENVIVSEALFY